MSAWIIVFSIRCRMKQWTLSVCFGETIVGDLGHPFLNWLTVDARSHICVVNITLWGTTNAFTDKLWYCVFGIFFVVFIFDWFTLAFGHLYILQHAVAKSGCRLMSCKNVGDGGVECACPAWGSRGFFLAVSNLYSDDKFKETGS